MTAAAEYVNLEVLNQAGNFPTCTNCKTEIIS